MCPNVPQCNYEEYELDMRKNYNYVPSWYHTLSFSFGTSFVEHIHTEPSYNIASLIGEVGGAMSFLLGFNGLGFIEVVLKSTFKMKVLNKRIYPFAVITMWLPFIYWSTEAMLRMNSEPISTKSYTAGSDIKSEFPMLTVCPIDIAPSILKQVNTTLDTYAKVPHFLSSLEKAAKNNPSVNYFHENFYNFDIHGVFKRFTVINEGLHHNLENPDSWKPVYHASYGYCWTLDIRREKDLVLIDAPMTLSFTIADQATFPSQLLMFLLHNKNDLSTATQHSSKLEVNLASKLATEFVFEKTNVVVESTNHTPCNDVYPQTCQDIKLNQIINDKYNCNVPFFNTGQHVLVNQSTPSCGHNETMQAFKILKEVEKECSSLMPCKFSRYKKTSRNTLGFATAEDSQGHIIFRMSNIVTTHESFVNYEFESLLYDISGTMGLFLGWSFLSLCCIIIIKINSKFIRIMLRRVIDIVFLIAIMVWSQDVIEKYRTQAVEMELQLDKQTSVPQVTICPYTAFKYLDGFNDAFPCGNNYIDFFQAVNNCLSIEPDIMEWLMKYQQPYQYHPLVNITLLSDKETLNLDNSVLEKVFHEKYGVCFSLDTTSIWKR